jgi:hypothetical protein
MIEASSVPSFANSSTSCVRMHARCEACVAPACALVSPDAWLWAQLSLVRNGVTAGRRSRRA